MQDEELSGKGTSPDFGGVPVLVTVTVGRATPTIEELLGMSGETVLTLDRGLEDPVDLFVGDRLIARGVLEEIPANGMRKLGVRITELVRTDPSA